MKRAALGRFAEMAPRLFNEFPADQLPLGYWKPTKIDLNEFITNGYNALGGRGKENHDMATLSTLYLAPETQDAKVQAS